MQPLGLTAAQTDAYLARLFGSHDYRIDVDILDLNENPVGSAVFTDGQVNFQDSSNAIRRTATLNVSDPTGALDFTSASTWSGSTIWVDRLIRIRHTLHVPALGRDVVVTPFIGPPSKLSRQSGDVTVELQDKAALATRGCPPYTVGKGTNAVSAIQAVLQHCTGEFRFRLGNTSRRLSKAYSVGWADESSPWTVATAIAGTELGAQLIYSCDGYVTLRPTPQAAGLVVPYVTDEAVSSVDFTSLINYVFVQGHSATTTKTTTSGSTVTTVATTGQPQSAAHVTSGPTAPYGLLRKGVPHFLPLLIQEDTYTTTAQTSARATSELANGARVDNSPTFSCVPFFHADVDDVIHFNTPGADSAVRLTTASIPLGAGEMSIGAVRWVSTAPGRVTASTFARTTTTTRKKK